MPHVVDMIKDTSKWVRNNAVSALGEIWEQCK